MPDIRTANQARTRTDRIAKLNDRARQGLDPGARTIFTLDLLNEMSDGSRKGDILAQAKIMKAMRNCEFTDNSPERDMAWFDVEGIAVMMKIDYYDLTFDYGSEDPSDASQTRRAITVMRPEDY